MKYTVLYLSMFLELGVVDVLITSFRDVDGGEERYIFNFETVI